MGDEISAVSLGTGGDREGDFQTVLQLDLRVDETSVLELDLTGLVPPTVGEREVASLPLHAQVDRPSGMSAASFFEAPGSGMASYWDDSGETSNRIPATTYESYVERELC
jgi:hypothetical protein